LKCGFFNKYRTVKKQLYEFFKKILLKNLIKALETTQPGKGNAIETKRGDNFSVVLETNPSTGYSWEPNFDSSYIQLIDRKYIPSSQKTLVGAGGKETFNFRALKGGEVEITFSYMRPWEKKEERKMVYKIIIN
jgi:predicted secreted protein